MADPRAFISFDFDNNLMDKYLFVGQIKRSRGACAGRRQPLGALPMHDIDFAHERMR